MDLEQVRSLRKRLSLTAAFLCCLTIIVAADGGIAFLREPNNTYRLLPGQSVNVTGPMAPDAVNLDGMLHETDSPEVVVTLQSVQSGFWFGGRMWRGRIDLSPQIQPGNYGVQIMGKSDGKRVGANAFQIVVYPDAEALRADSKSLLLRNAGVSPWMLAGGFFGSVLLICAILYRVSGKRDALMAERGEAEVFHVKLDSGEVVLFFGLGQKHGISRGSELLLLDSAGREIGETRVESVSDSDGMARVALSTGARPGYLVRKR